MQRFARARPQLNERDLKESVNFAGKIRDTSDTISYFYGIRLQYENLENHSNYASDGE